MIVRHGLTRRLRGLEPVCASSVQAADDRGSNASGDIRRATTARAPTAARMPRGRGHRTTARRDGPSLAERVSILVAPALTAVLAVTLFAAEAVELRSVGGVPAHLAGTFREPLAFQELPDGRRLVFDRRAHAVFLLDAAATSATKIVDIGGEEGRVLAPVAMDAAADGTFVVADAPNRRERIQHFDPDGTRLGGFTLPGRAAPRVTVGPLVLNGVGSLEFTGKTILINQPETGSVITEYSLTGYPMRSIGRLRATGHEDDRALHLSLNTGLPLVTPDGGFFFVFQTGEPVFRRYDRTGALAFERLVQGRELDDFVRTLPKVWPTRQVDAQELPLVTPTVRTAAVDRDGGLWLSFTVPVTYRFDRDGDRVAAYRLRAAGPLQPTSLFFTDRNALLVTPGLFEFGVPSIPHP